MVYFGLFTHVADNADDVEADTAVDTMRLGVVVDGRQQTPTFPVVDGLFWITIQTVATGLYFHDDQRTAILCHDVEIMMTGFPVAFNDGITLFLEKGRSQVFSPPAKFVVCSHLFLAVLITDLYTADLSTDGLRQFFDELDDTGILVGSCFFLDMLLEFLDQVVASLVLPFLTE